MSIEFSNVNLRLARQRHKWTVTQLAEKTGISSREISRIENGEVSPNESTANELAAKLCFPVSFFYSESLTVPDHLTFRKVADLSKRDSEAGKAAASLGFRLSEWLDTEFELPTLNLPNLSGHRPELAAKILREEWGLGERPITNMIKLLEANGVRVYSLYEETLDLDAFATWFNERPFVFLNRQKSGERGRFDAAHELAHLVLHRNGEQGKEVESEANKFASAFLMPEGDVYAKRVFPTLGNLTAIKSRWNVALSALVHRYEDLNLLSEDRAKWLYIEMSRKKYLKNEPFPTPRDDSQIWKFVIKSLWNDRKTIGHIEKKTHIPEKEIIGLTFMNITPNQTEIVNSSKFRIITSK